MCGICGIIRFNSLEDNDIETTKKMSNAIAHRGPDAEGFFHDEHVVFGHRRLSIIDLSTKADQPLKSIDNKFVIVFNGEIYNYQEIKDELVEFEFSTDHSDTEVVLNAYRKWGIECLQKFVGMFAFSIYDVEEKTVLIARDRIGQKPLYYYNPEPNKFYFSSEIHSFFSSGAALKKVREESIYNYLTFLTVNAPHTFYEGINKLEAGQYLKIGENEINKGQFWNVSDFINKVNDDSEEQAIKETESLLERSMHYRNISDVPVTLALSGGLDSSLNLFYSKSISNPATINLSYEVQDEDDESNIAEKFAKEKEVSFTKKIVGKDEFVKLIKHYLPEQRDMPQGDPNSVFVYLLSEMSRESGSKVLLVGEGGDEIGGYPAYLGYQKEALWLKYFSWTRFIAPILPYKVRKKLDCYFEGNIISERHIHGFKETEKQKFWKGATHFNSYKILNDYMSEINVKSKDSHIRKILNVEYKLRLPEMILARIDYPSMSGSIEARSPFVDHKLIEYSCTLPFDLKMKSGAKHILRKIAKDKLPSYILDHKKVGFGKLIVPFLNDELPIWFENELIQSETKLTKYIEKTFLEEMLSSHKKTKRLGYKMWVLYSLHKWLEQND